VTAVALGAAVVVTSIGGGGSPAAAATRAAAGHSAPIEGATSATTTEAGKGQMESDQVALSGSIAPEPGIGRSTPPEEPATPDTAPDAGPAPGEAGWSTTLDLLPGTQMVALSWDGSRSGPSGPASGRVSLRSRSGGAEWTPWLPVKPDPNDAGGEGTGRVGSDVVWLGSAGADEVEVRVDAGPLVEFELLRMRYHEGEPRVVTAPPPETTTSEGSRHAQPTIRPRSDWASSGWATWNSGCGSGPTYSSRLDHAVVHHTASTNSYTAAQVPGLLDGIYRYHTASLGWCDIAYNFVVDAFGTIWQGRSGDITRPVLGGHARGFNSYSVGVSLLGQFEPGASPSAIVPTLAMFGSTARLLAWKLGLHGLDPKGSVTLTSAGSTRYSEGTLVTLPVINAHQQSSLTACPGANMMSRMAALRDAVAGQMDSPPPPPPPPPPSTVEIAPFSSVEALVYRQYEDWLRNPGTYAERAWWADALRRGDTHRNALVASLLRSGTVDEDSASIVRLYLAYFDRPPDSPGIRYWWAEMDRGRGLRTTSAAFARSREFTRLYGQLSDAEFVDLVYRNVLRRAPDASGRSYWIDRLRRRAESRGGLMVLFSESGEFRTGVAAATQVILVHEVMLGRAIGVTALFEWVDRAGRESITALIDQIFRSSEYARRVT